MNKIIKSVSHDMLCVAKRRRRKNVLRGPSFYINYVVNLNDVWTQYFRVYFPHTHTCQHLKMFMGEIASELLCQPRTGQRDLCRRILGIVIVVRALNVIHFHIWT